MSSKKTTDNMWSMNYSYKLTPDSQKYFFNYTDKSKAQLRHEVENEMSLLRDIDAWVDVMDDYPEANEIIDKIRKQ